MAVSAEKFVANLSESGLLEADEVHSFVATLTPASQSDAQAIARELIRQKKLTKFQATAVYQGKTKMLVFGEYTVLDQIGKGGMGVVFKARHRRMKREVAVKVLPAATMKDEDAIKRFYREVEAAAKLMHSNIVTALDASEHEGMHYLVMEFVDGRDLAEIVQASGPLPVEETVEMIVQAARGLEYAHNQGVVHRDIKPSNLLLSKDGEIKILDMGLARLRTDGLGDQTASVKELTESGQVMGTIDYMSPEQAEDTRQADHRADIYSLGCTLHRLLSGSVVYEGDTIMKKLLAHREAPIPSLREKCPNVPVHLDETFQQMIAKRPDDRYRSMTEVIAALQTCLVPDANAPSLAAKISNDRSSSDHALSSFFQNIDREHATTQPTVAPHDETIDLSRQDEDTGDRVPIKRHTKVLAKKEDAQRKGDKRVTWLAIVLGAICVAALTGLILFMVSGNDPEPNPDTPPITGNDTDSNKESNKEQLSESTIVIQLELEQTIDHGSDVVHVAFSPDGKTLATQQNNNVIELRKPGESEVAVTISGPSGETHRGGRGRLSFSPDGKVLLSVHTGFHLWDTASGDEISRPQEAFQHVRTAAISNDEYIGMANQEDAILLVDARTHETKLKLKHHRVNAFAFDPKKRVIVTVGEDRAIKAWQWDGTPQGTLDNAHEAPIFDAVISSDGARLATSALDKTVKLWDPVEGSLFHTIKESTDIHTLAFSPSSRVLAGAVDYSNDVVLWDAISGKAIKRFAPHHSPTLDIAFSPDGRWFATASEDQTVRLWRYREVAELVREFVAYDAPVGGVSISPDGKRLATGADKGVVKIWNLDTGEVRELNVPKLWYKTVTFSPDGKWLAAAGTGQPIKIINVKSGQVVKEIAANSWCDWSHDSKLIAGGSYDDNFRVFEADTWREKYELDHSRPVVAFAPDNILVTGNPQGIKSWDMADGSHLSEFDSPDDVCWIAHHPTTKNFVTVSHGSPVLMKIHSPSSESIEFEAEHSLSQLKYSPDGTILAGSLHYYKKVILWDANTGKELAQIVHPDGVSGLDFTSDGRMVTGCSDGRIRLFDIQRLRQK